MQQATANQRDKYEIYQNPLTRRIELSWLDFEQFEIVVELRLTFCELLENISVVWENVYYDYRSGASDGNFALL